jgi:hypothetical protein
MAKPVSKNLKENDHRVELLKSNLLPKAGAQSMHGQIQDAATTQGASPTTTPHTFFAHDDPWLAGKEPPSQKVVETLIYVDSISNPLLTILHR